MPLTLIPALFAAARSKGYSLGYFESWNLELPQGTIEAAGQYARPIKEKDLSSPVSLEGTPSRVGKGPGVRSS